MTPNWYKRSDRLPGCDEARLYVLQPTRLYAIRTRKSRQTKYWKGVVVGVCAIYGQQQSLAKTGGKEREVGSVGRSTNQ